MVWLCTKVVYDKAASTCRRVAVRQEAGDDLKIGITCNYLHLLFPVPAVKLRKQPMDLGLVHKSIFNF